MSLASEIRRRLGPPPQERAWPPISIVVLNRDGVEHLRRLLEGLCEFTDYPDLELVVVDNASSDGSLDFLRQVEAPFPVSFHANPHNESFSDGCNQGAALVTGELLLFLNNDVEPFEPAWLRELVAFWLGSNASAVGPTLIEPADAPSGYAIEQRGHRIGETEGALVPVYRDRGGDALAECPLEDEEVVAAVAACLLIGRDAFDAVGGFTRGFWYGGEDSDLSLKLRERGRCVACSGRSLLIHTPNATLNTVVPDRRAEWVRGNRRFFMERWGPRLRREYELDRLRGGGLWADPSQVDGPTRGATEAEIEALGFCLKSVAPDSAGAGEPSLERIAEELRCCGRRAIALSGDRVDDLGGLEQDVVVHRGGAGRYAPKPAQLNVLQLPDDALSPPAIEGSRYDLLLRTESSSQSGSAELAAKRLIEASEALANELGFRTRISA